MFISVYGKGGIGKSTISSNLAVAFSKYGKKVLQIGCDPKHDSTFTIKHQMIPTIIEKLNEHDFHHEEISREDVIFEGYNDVNVVEAGGPPSGTGCAGYVVGEGIRLLENLNAFSDYDVVVFDVLGDIVCGGFSLPMNYSDYVLIVSKNDFDSLFAANRIIQGALEKSQSYPVKVAGIIANQCSTCEYIEEYSEIINTKIICRIKNDPLLKQSRFMGKTIYELSDEDPRYNYLKDNFNKIAKYILNKPIIENPNTMPEREMFEKFSNQRIIAN